ncbi:hypothetical protein NC653_008387 [Populus alba x Populus x berolinensis]|uniref:Uncharacterized protein n=1 Tax=Populus alba x Populus x berolinensis TaxID=444605 RepID=A0AAD6R6L3_9ROSI|nr:hypothetical protein NC653_008387 [Populus alba x Populus x berolinensis]
MKILPFDPILIDSPRFLDPPLDLCSSRRFFVTPGPSSSLVEEARSGLAATSKNMGSTSTSMSTCCDNLNDASATVASNDIKQVRVPDDCIAAALTDSPSPCKKRWKRNCRIMGRLNGISWNNFCFVT